MSRIEPDFKKPCHTFDDLSAVVRAVPSGVALLNEMLPYIRCSRVGLHSLTEAPQSLATELETRRIYQRPGAVFWYDGLEQKIFVEWGEEVGILAPLFFHEATHCLDREYLGSWKEVQALWKRFGQKIEELSRAATARTGKRREELILADFSACDRRDLLEMKRRWQARDEQRILESERKAHRETRRFVAECLEIWPSYAGLIEESLKHGHAFARAISDQELCQAYGLSLNVLKAA